MASDEPKTADNLLKMIRQVLHIIEEEWKAIPIAVTSDCGGESLAARVHIVAERPELVGPDCYAHQVRANPINTAYVL